MTLDTVLGQLTTGEGEDRKTNSEYDSNLIVKATEELKKLKETDITTQEGLEDYGTITGDDPSKYSQDMAGYRKKIRLSGGQEDLSTYAEKHLKKIIVNHVVVFLKIKIVNMNALKDGNVWKVSVCVKV